MDENTRAMLDFYGPPISVYTRQQAIEDGMLHDAGDLGREAGFVAPVAYTADVAAILNPDHADFTGRLWDTLFMAMLRWKVAIRNTTNSYVPDPAAYKVIVGRRMHTFMLYFNEYEGFTIQLPGE